MRKEDKSKNILFIYSCLQGEVLLQHNIVEIFKSVSEIGDGANIYVLSSRDTLKLILPDNVHFFVEKITTYRIKEIVKKYNIGIVYPVIGDNDIIIRQLSSFFKKNNVVNVFSNYYSNRQNTKKLVPFARKIGFARKRRKVLRFARKQKKAFVNYICVKDTFGNQIILDVFDSFFDEKNHLFCSQSGFCSNEELLKIRTMIDELGKFVECSAVLYCISVEIEDGVFFFQDIKFGKCYELLFFLQKKTLNHNFLIKKIKDKFYIFPKINREDFYYSRNSGKKGNFFLKKSSDRFYEKVCNFICKTSTCSVEYLCSFLKQDFRAMHNFIYQNEVVFVRKQEACGAGNNLLIVDFYDKNVEINDRLLFFRICQGLSEAKNGRLVYLSDRIPCLASVLPNCDIITIEDDLKDEDLRKIIDDYAISDVFLNPIRSNECCFDKLCRMQKSFCILGLKKGFKFFNEESLFNLANECNMVFQGERFDQKQKIIHFLCFKDRYNNVIFPKVVNEDFVYTSGLHCLFSPISGFDYGCKNAIIGYALSVLEKTKCSGIIDIEFIYSDGDVFLKNIIINDSKVLFLESGQNNNYFINVIVKSLLGEDIFALKKDELDVEKRFFQNIAIIHNDGQTVVVNGKTTRRALADYYSRINGLQHKMTKIL